MSIDQQCAEEIARISKTLVTTADKLSGVIKDRNRLQRLWQSFNHQLGQPFAFYGEEYGMHPHYLKHESTDSLNRWLANYRRIAAQIEAELERRDEEEA